MQAVADPLLKVGMVDLPLFKALTADQNLLGLAESMLFRKVRLASRSLEVMSFLSLLYLANLPDPGISLQH